MFESNHRAALQRCPTSLKPSVTAGRIIVAGVNARQRAHLRAALELEGHQVTEADSDDQTMERASSGLHHVLIMDSSLDGAELCRMLRPKSDLGIIVLAGGDTTQDRIDALNAGADDFIPPSMVLEELLARVRAILRRVTRSNEERQLVLQDREVDLKSHEIKGPGNRVSHLTPKEFLVLQSLVANANKPRTAQNLAQTIWKRDGGGELEFVRVVIKQLRRKIEPNPDDPRYILSERSVGYRFQMPSVDGAAGVRDVCVSKR